MVPSVEDSLGHWCTLRFALVPDEERISATRRIAAPAAAIFAIVSDPAGQVAIDGSHMLVAAPDAKRLEAVGDTFTMDMDREALGDLPLGKYRCSTR